MNQTRVTNDVISSKISDFEIDGRTFEIGGKNKGNKQIENAGKGYVVKDDIETGYANVILSGLSVFYIDPKGMDVSNCIVCLLLVFADTKYYRIIVFANIIL